MSIRFFLFVFLALPLSLKAQEDLNVIQPHWVNFKDGPDALYKHLTKQAFAYLDEREEKLAAIESLEDWKTRQAWAKEKLREVLGPFPQKTPLNPQITGTIEKDGYRLEHVVFESQPGFHVTSTIYIPVPLKGKAPAIIYCSGHAQEGYRSSTYQHVILNLVKKGFIVLAFDPVGQGERLEYFDPETNQPIVGGPTKQHSYPGAQAFIAGTSQANYMIWDGIRAVDYLLTRKEVDTERIGITGRSGGGTQSAYIAAFDERIHVAAPENYITTFRRLWLTHGPQDAEQNFYRGIQAGLDQPDLLIVRAPKPSLMITTTRDIFNIEGAREAYDEVKRVYEAYRSTDSFEMVEDDAAHASTLKNREAMYAFFQKHLNLPGSSKDEVTDTLTTEELQVTRTGQALTSYKAKTIFDLNQDVLVDLNERSSQDLVETASALSGYVAPEGNAETMMTGRFQRDGYTVEKHLVKGEGDYWLPFLLMKPEEPTSTAVLYLDPSGKAKDAGINGDMEALVKAGVMVLAPDLLDTGEMGKGGFTGDSNFEGHSYNLWFGSILIGRSITGIHAGDVNRLVNVLHGKAGAAQVKAVAKGAMSSVLLHAAAFNPSITSIALVDPLVSFRDIVKDRMYDPSHIAYSVPYSGKAYDLPQLMAYLSDRKPMILSSENGAQPSSSIHVEQLPASVRQTLFQASPVTDQERQGYLREWVRR